MYNGRPFLQIFIFLKKFLIATVALQLVFSLIVTNIQEFPISDNRNLISTISIYTAIFIALLNTFQGICVFVDVNRLFRIIYVISCYLSNALIVTVCVVNLQISNFMYAGIIAGAIGLALLSYEFYTKRSAMFDESN
ncbi:hypothetical protein [Oenococcus kitaharae]|uniref:Integral membrane protein n=1 Tax=Oenococcus kitaharae DSM 17330 TaxID=1045004 RepID=G9WGF4_9LACO|nr:hypothetical protein [Oenococcus kitaharae]EHN59781.1 hypothetical protein OKIT_1706 [Oenococcus kitaharae DSM 17330]OEY83602.1 hypothetical protein NT95_05735 [Oenococcus kitaharae]OEY85400.1 hypothetical protein NT96_02180 [Oenococcus kitaharae]OEY86253.1 hypothetical protein NV75_02130 [Oenococcus kitaharae]